MYIHNLESGIDELQGYGLVDPNIVSGADLDVRIFNRSGFYGYVSNDEVEVAKAKYEQARAAFNDGQAKVQEAGTMYGRVMGQLRTNGERLTLLKAIKGGVARGTSYDGKMSSIEYEIDFLEGEQAKLGQQMNPLSEAVQAANYALRDLNLNLETAKAEYDAIVLKQKNEGTPPDNTTTQTTTSETTSGSGSNGGTVVNVSGGGSFSGAIKPAVPLEVAKKGIVEQIGDKVGLSKNQTYMALGAAGILAVALIVKK